MKRVYRLTNSNGMTHGGWAAEYDSLAAAKKAMKQLRTIKRLFCSESYTTGEKTRAISCYRSLADMRRDVDGSANAPTIEWSVQ
jgi:hypothetical protein